MNKNSAIKVGLLTLQVTNRCNLRCLYCYLDGKENRALMSKETVQAALTRLRDEDLVGPEIQMSWQLGEPLLAGIGFYEQAFALTRKILGETTKVVQHVQTNATLLNRRWSDFLEKHHVRVGVSLDGPQHLHDANRLYPDGSRSHAAVMRGIGFLKRVGILPAIICVITRRSLDFANEIHDFFHHEGLRSVSFNAEEVEGIHGATSIVEEEDWRERYKNFLTNFFLRARQCDNRVAVREFTNVEEWLRTRRPRASGPALPFHHVTVNVDGGFGTFSPELIGLHHSAYGSFVMGNVHQNSICSVAKSYKYQQLWSQIKEGLLRCKETCSAFSLCGGGSPSNKLLENGTFASTKTVACEAGIRIPFEVVTQFHARTSFTMA